jgi:hypothetical protein
MTRYSISLTNDQWRTVEHLVKIDIKTHLDGKGVEDFTDPDFDLVVILRMVQAARKDFGNE